MNPQTVDVTAVLPEVLASLPVPAVVATADGRVSAVSRGFCTVTGLSESELLGDGFRARVFPLDISRALDVFAHANATASRYRDEYRFRFADGTYRWLGTQAEPIDENGALTAWFAVFSVIDEAKRAERGVELLSDTGAATVTLDYHATLHNVADASVRRFACYCIIDIEDAEHPWERFVAHRDPALAARLTTLSKPTDVHHINRTLADGGAYAVTIDERWLGEVNANADRAALTRDYGVRSVIIAPVRAPDGRVIGAITMGIDRTDETGRVYVDEDVPFVEEVGRRAGAAITNARLFERNRRIAAELQATSLPRALPQPEGLALEAYYRPGSDEATIGGDWYDALVLEDGRIAISLGDVRGHGLTAAITMTKLRQAMQSAAMVRPSPSVMLAVADRTMRALDPDSYATAIAAIIDPTSGDLVLASAGHPPPLLVHGGRAEEIPVHGIMLGLAGNEFAVQHAVMPPGSRIVFYTDGLVEASRDVADGLARLRDAAVEEPRADAMVARALGATTATDDVAVLTAHFIGTGDAKVRRATEPSATWTFESGDAEAARGVRHAFVSLADARYHRCIDTAAAELILGELAGNAVRHAPGTVTVRAQWSADGMQLTVTTEGPPFTPPEAAGPNELRENGRGLALVRALGENLDVRTSSEGLCEVRVTMPYV